MPRASCPERRLRADAPAPSWSNYLDDSDVQRLTAADAPKGWLPLRAASKALGLSSQAAVNQVKPGKLDLVYVTRGRVNGLRIRIPSTTSTT